MEKRELILDLLARNKMRGGTQDAASDLDKLGRAAESADKKTAGLGKSTEKASEETDKLGHNLSDTKSRVSGLDREISNINRELAALSASFADAANGADRLDISRAIRRTENDLRRVTKNRNFLSNLLPDPEPEAKSWASRASSSLGDSLISGLASSPKLGIAGGVIGLAMAPTLGASIAAGVLGAVGSGGIIGGVAAAASSDQAIKDYGTKIGKNFVERVQAEGRNAFSGPIMQSLGKFEAFADRSILSIGKIFRDTAPMLAPFTDHVIRAGDALMGSLSNGASKAGPVMDALGRVVEGTAVSLGKFIDMAADHSDEAASAIDDINSAIQGTIEVATFFVDALSSMKGALDDFDDKIDEGRYWLEDHMHFLDLTADGYYKTSEAAKLYRKGIIGAKGEINDYDHYLQGAIGSTNKLKDAHGGAATAAELQKKAEQELTAQLKAQTDPAFGLLNAIDQVHAAQKDAATSAKKYGTNSDEARAATRKLAEAAIALQGAASGAGGLLDGKLSPALRNTLRQAGLTKSQMAGVERELRRAKAAADAYDGMYKATIKTVYIEESYRVGGKDYNREANRAGFSKRAAGGPAVRGTPYIVGEHGPEMFVPDSTGRVINSSATRGMGVEAGLRGMAGTLGASRGGDPRWIELRAAGGADQGVATLINYLIRTGRINATVAA